MPEIESISKIVVMDSQYTYYAFISYQRKDEKWAKWLQRRLEHYKLPVANPNESSNNKPKYLRPVFRDKTDLTAGPLPDALKSALEQSKYLIVVCSPNAVKSSWVNEEIETFISAGRIEYVIPFIVDGEPNAIDDSKECFPNALRAIPKEKELLGVNIFEVGKEQAFLRTVAYMLGVKFDELWNRHERQKRIVRNVVIACVAVLAVIALGIYDYTRTKVEYYADWVDCNGVAQGVYPLSDQQVAHRYFSYKFEYKRIPFGEPDFYSWRLKRLSVVNSKNVISADYVAENHDFFYPVQEYNYTDGYVTEIVNRDKYNRVVLRYAVKDDENRNPACIVDLERKYKHQGSAFLNSSTTTDALTDNFSKIKRFHYTRDDYGRVRVVTYHANDSEDVNESAISDNNNIFGKKYELDSIGRIVVTRYINDEGEYVSDKYGIAAIVHRYDGANLMQTDFLDIDGNLTYNNHKYARCVKVYDNYGNETALKYYGSDSLPCYNEDNTFKFEYKYDHNGFMIEAASYGVNGELIYNKSNWSIVKFENDKMGHSKVISFYGVDKRPCYNDDNISVCHIEYGSFGQQTCLSFFNTEGEASLSKSQGVHRVSMEYNKNGDMVKQSFFDKCDRLYTSPVVGWACVNMQYDSYSNLVSVSFYDENHNPVIQKNGYHEERRAYDNKGNVISATYYDEKGNRCYSTNGWSSLRKQYDIYGNITEESYLGTENEPIYINHESRTSFLYTKNGLCRESRSYDANDSLCLNNLWYAIEKTEYAHNGNPIRISYYDRDSLPCYVRNGVYFAVEKIYNGNDCVEERYFDKNMTLHENAFNYAIVKNEYDKQHRSTSYSYYNADGSPCMNSDLFHSQSICYTPQGLVSSTEYYDVNRNPCNLRDDYSKKLCKYDNKGLLIEELFYDKNGNPRNGKYPYRKTYEYDEYGRIVKECSYDEHNVLTWAPVDDSVSGPMICQVEYEYDDWGNISKKIYLDPNDKLTVRPGCAIIKSVYDEIGRPKSIEYLGENGDYIGGGSNYPIERYSYDKDFEKISYYYDDSTFVTNVNIYSRENLPVKITYTDINENLWVKQVRSFYKCPFAICTNDYDPRGNVIKRSFFNEKGMLLDSLTNYAYEVLDYDNRGYLTSLKHYNCKDELSNVYPGGWAVGVQKNDIYGNLTEQSYYDNNGDLAQTPWGWSRRLWEYDDMGRCTFDVYFYCDGTSNGVRVAYKDDGTAVYDRMRNGVWESNVVKVETNELDEKDRMVIVAEVQNYGQMYEKGFRGTFIILEWNDWDCTSNLDDFIETFSKSKGEKKRLVLLPVGTTKNISVDKFGEVVEYTFSEEPLMARVMDSTFKDSTIRSAAIRKYKEWKESR